MDFINIGFGNLLSFSRIVAVISPDSAPVKRMISDAKDAGKLIDATYGRKTSSVIVSDSGHIVLSALSADEISERAAGR